jgi:hypothetical protein
VVGTTPLVALTGLSDQLPINKEQDTRHKEIPIINEQILKSKNKRMEEKIGRPQYICILAISPG